jgi:uncharacterized protein with HEPN domain
MRDVLAHAYFGVDLRFVWSTATTQIDKLEAAARSLLASPSGSGLESKLSRDPP